MMKTVFLVGLLFLISSATMVSDIKTEAEALEFIGILENGTESNVKELIVKVMGIVER